VIEVERRGRSVYLHTADVTGDVTKKLHPQDAVRLAAALCEAAGDDIESVLRSRALFMWPRRKQPDPWR